MPWKRMLAYVTGSVHEDLLRGIEYLLEENRVREYLAHYDAERNHQDLENVIPFPGVRLDRQEGPVVKAERLGGLLNFYHRQAA